MYPFSSILAEAKHRELFRVGFVYIDLFKRQVGQVIESNFGNSTQSELQMVYRKEYSLASQMNNATQYAAIDEILLGMKDANVNVACFVAMQERNFILSRIGALGINFAAVSFDIVPSEIMIDMLGPVSNYVTTSVFWSPVLSTPCEVFGSNAEFVKGFTELHGYIPTEVEAKGASIMVLLQLAMQAQGSFYIERMVDAFEALEANTFWGPMKFSINHNNIGRDFLLTQIQNEKVMIVKPAALASSSLIIPAPSWDCRSIIREDEDEEVCEDLEFSIWRECAQRSPQVMGRYNSSSCLLREEMELALYISSQTNSTPLEVIKHSKAVFPERTKVAIFIISAVILFFIGALGLWIYFFKSKHGLWIKSSEVLSEDANGNITVLGMGTFGFVYASTFRGSKVAVKAVVPKNYKYLLRKGAPDHLAGTFLEMRDHQNSNKRSSKDSRTPMTSETSYRGLLDTTRQSLRTSAMSEVRESKSNSVTLPRVDFVKTLTVLRNNSVSGCTSAQKIATKSELRMTVRPESFSETARAVSCPEKPKQTGLD
eukprot:CAMPEP_0196596122 /NCGR_PEP_ID=MMETSP1081-20130531/84254_1 /TAXON_ID=36882 /ORGANISM="Pyramimonas amylifera, Strain CCMP720" /LENGTH=541 /DNA_ID=CAMNT_0041920983 /DNA_START=208 /DNA_END=1830 /DNA_ORIENTATION=-